MKILIIISISLFSILSAKDIRFINNINGLPNESDPSLTDIDRATKRFLQEKGQNFTNVLHKQIVKRKDIKIKSSSSKNRITIKGEEYYCGNYIYSDQQGIFNRMYKTFHENSLVEIYTMFNIIYAIKTHGDTEFVLSVKDALYTINEVKNRGDLDNYIAVKLKNVPKEPPKTLFRQFNQYGSYVYPAIPAMISIMYFIQQQNAVSKYQEAQSVGSEEGFNYYYDKSQRYGTYAALAGASSIAIAIPLNWNHIKNIWER